MDQDRLIPEVLPPRRRGRPLVFVAAFAFLVAAGAANFFAGTRCERHHRCARARALAAAPMVPSAVRLDFESDPPGVDVQRLSGDALGCHTPCALRVPRGGVEEFRMTWPDGAVTTTSADTMRDGVVHVDRARWY